MELPDKVFTEKSIKMVWVLEHKKHKAMSKSDYFEKTLL